jgi:protein-tyrosine kinase
MTMEKIQAAIAKARETRTQTGVSPALALPQADSGIIAPDAGSATASSALSAAQIAAAWTSLPGFAPKAAHLRRNRIVAFEGGREAMAFDVMRTRLIQQMRANNWRRLAITSPGPGCGKSMLALNLAFSLGRQQDQRTLVIDLDMRRPSMAKYLGVSAEHSVAKVLNGTADFAGNALRYGTNLAFACHQGAVANSAELLQSTQAAGVLDRISAAYDPTIMIFDMPPMQAGDDVMAFASQVDCVLLVAAAGDTTIKQVDTCERDLAAQTNVLGVVLNKCRYMGGEESYGYYD